MGQPFFLFYAHTMPHYPISASDGFRAKSKNGLYGDVIEEIDWSLGEIIKTLKELDILETVGREIDDKTGDGVVHFSVHTRAYYFKQGNEIKATKTVKQLGNRFHTYALEWTPEAMKIFFDGEHMYTYDKNANELEFPFNKPQNLILNMSMGGGMGWGIDPSLTAERMEVEYIRVYGRQ